MNKKSTKSYPIKEKNYILTIFVPHELIILELNRYVTVYFNIVDVIDDYNQILIV